jgi:hypothetical protein
VFRAAYFNRGVLMGINWVFFLKSIVNWLPKENI